MEDVMKLLTKIKPLIDREIEKHIPRRGTPQVLFDGCWKYFDYGGKRHRPALITLSCETLDGKIEDTIIAGAGLEMAHTFLLIHDDIEDFSQTRRGNPCLHVIYGTPHAVNMGDYLFFKVYETLLSGKDSWGTGKTLKIIELMTEMFKKTGEGQAMEIDQRDKDLSEVTLKNFGFAIGVAFQIQDDILNLTMSEEEVKLAPGTGGGGYGKDFAGDLKEGKRTLVLVHAFQNADEIEKDRMRELIGNKDIALEQKKEVITIMNKLGSIEYAKNYARKMMEDAVEKMKLKTPATEGRNKLESIAQFLIERKF